MGSGALMGLFRPLAVAIATMMPRAADDTARIDWLTHVLAERGHAFDPAVYAMASAMTDPARPDLALEKVISCFARHYGLAEQDFRMNPGQVH